MKKSRLCGARLKEAIRAAFYQVQQHIADLTISDDSKQRMVAFLHRRCETG
jgi:hypothetical protein